MVNHDFECPKCHKKHSYESNITKPNSKQSSMHGYTWDYKNIICECGYVINIRIEVKFQVY